MPLCVPIERRDRLTRVATTGASGSQRALAHRTFGGKQLDFYREKLQRNKWRSGEMKEISFPLCESAADVLPLTAPSAQRVNLPPLNY